MKSLLHCVFRYDGRDAPEQCGPGVAVVHGHGLAVAASPWSDGEAPPGVARLLAYEKAIAVLHATRTVVPLRFGCVMEGPSQILGLLEERGAEFEELLDRLEGLTEMGVRVWWDHRPGVDVARAAKPAVPRVRTPDLVESALSLPWGRFPTCPAAMQDFPTGQVGNLPHEGSTEIPASPAFPPATSGVRRVVSTLVDACDGLPSLETSPRMATRQAWQPAPRSGSDGCEKCGLAPGARYLAAARRRHAGLSPLDELWAQRICGSLEGSYVRQKREARPVSEGRLLSLHFLTARAAAGDFRERVRRLTLPGEAKLLVSGPWPPYNFTGHA